MFVLKEPEKKQLEQDIYRGNCMYYVIIINIFPWKAKILQKAFDAWSCREKNILISKASKKEGFWEQV